MRSFGHQHAAGKRKLNREGRDYIGSANRTPATNDASGGFKGQDCEKKQKGV
jgi:hypothetical protein